MWHSIKIGLFIGITTASLLVFLLRIVPMTPLIMIIILYTYGIVGVLTAYFIHKRLIKTKEEIIPRSFSRRLQKREKVFFEPSLSEMDRYNPTLDTLNELKATVDMVKNLIVVRKELEKLKSESRFLMESGLDGMSRKAAVYEDLVVKSLSKKKK